MTYQSTFIFAESNFHNLGKVSVCERRSHSHVSNDSHRFIWDRPLPDIAVGPSGNGIHPPCLQISNIPFNRPLAAQLILKPISLILLLIVPIVIQNRNTRNSFLDEPTTICIQGGKVRAIDINMVVVRLLPQIEGCDLNRLRGRANNNLALLVDSSNAGFDSINFRGRSRFPRAQIILAGESMIHAGSFIPGRKLIPSGLDRFAMIPE